MGSTAGWRALSLLTTQEGTDREQIYLCDFGLATSPQFDLSADERDFTGGTRHA
jgi:hypothetical protein